ncbi:ABC transporter ATP-binding protein [Lignipirellula cremea]|uniref:Putative ABC transporter ATP-binding protein YxlF n=1 Tax=Lignipirellula cremea TaxID=2528010 RepID=A0A518DP26_9BACT|nr:ABC transporter ATP-binding protein [Lignipirellula cremea]QDU93589.1 putative ABC transporter ATP-binding protein YxlF [Lignipirellula cremea]
MIELENVTRRYGAKVAVDNLSLKIGEGELFAFLGPNGAGKTTTIKMLTGLLRPNSGAVRIGGVDAGVDPCQANRLTGYVPDQPFLYDKLTGREFLAFIAEMYGLEQDKTAQAIADQIENFELHAFVDHLAESYSHGMKQRLVFAAALIHRPKVLIVDEPMVGLDPRSMRLVKDLLRREAEQGATVFMSTHTLSVAEEIADRIGVFQLGKVRFLGTVQELRSQLARDDNSLEQLFLELTSHEGDAVSTAQPE